MVLLAPEDWGSQSIQYSNFKNYIYKDTVFQERACTGCGSFQNIYYINWNNPMYLILNFFRKKYLFFA